MNLPELGVGVTYFSGIEPVLEKNAGLIDVLEIEPQTIWGRSRSDGKFHISETSLAHIGSYSCPKLIHGIGFPVGGTLPPDSAQNEPMWRMIAALRPPWMSEHLSFNRIGAPIGEIQTMFLLPPRQTLEGANAAAQSVRTMATAMPVPLAVETGVNYLKPRRDEISDGEFVAAIVDAADCGILLDLHNLWTNERNGRQPIEEFLSQIPLERVWEVHLAGGAERGGYWLDAHSGPVQPELLECSRRILQRMPNLRALILEVFPAYLPVVGEGFFQQQLEDLHRVWDRRGGTDTCTISPGRSQIPSPQQAGPSAAEWEDALGRLVIGRPSGSALELELAGDPGIPIIKELLEEFRASSVVSSLRLSTRLLMLTRGEEELRHWLGLYWGIATPQPFASDEGAGFAEFLREQKLEIPHFQEVLDFDLALIATQIDGQSRIVTFSVAPLPLLRALSAGKMPKNLELGEYELVITADEMPISPEPSNFDKATLLQGLGNFHK